MLNINSFFGTWLYPGIFILLVILGALMFYHLIRASSHEVSHPSTKPLHRLFGFDTTLPVGTKILFGRDLESHFRYEDYDRAIGHRDLSLSLRTKKFSS